MTKLRFRPLDVSEWVELDRRAPAPTFFARPAWAIAIERAFPRLIAHPLACRLDDGTDAFVPLTRVHGRLRWTLYHGMPFDGYTAVGTAQGPLDDERAAQVFSALFLVGDEVILNPWPMGRYELRGANIHIPTETSALDLGGTLAGAQAAIASKSRRMAGQATRKGAVCHIETGSEAVNTYYRLLCEAATERWGRAVPTISFDFFNEVVATGGEAVEIWIVRYQGEPVSGGVALYGSKEVSLWTTATKPGLEIVRPHNLLHATIMEHAGSRGIQWYNLSSSSGLEGVLRFKRALGAELFNYEITGRRRLRYQLARAIQHVGKGGTS